MNQQHPQYQEMPPTPPQHQGSEINPIVLGSPRLVKMEALSQEPQDSTAPETPKAVSASAAKTRTIKKEQVKKVNPQRRGYDLFRSELHKRLKIEDLEKYKRIYNDIVGFTKLASNAWRALDQDT